MITFAHFDFLKITLRYLLWFDLQIADRKPQALNELRTSWSSPSTDSQSSQSVVFLL